MLTAILLMVALNSQAETPAKQPAIERRDLTDLSPCSVDPEDYDGLDECGLDADPKDGRVIGGRKIQRAGI